MKKKFLIILLCLFSLIVVGCSKQYSSSSVQLKQEYNETFTPYFTWNSEDITKTSINLYNKIATDKIPEVKTFASEYIDFGKINPSNASEKDFQDCVHKFEIDYSLVALDTSLLNVEQDLRDRGIESKDKYEINMKNYRDNKTKYLAKVKPDLDNIMKYYQ